MKHGLTAIALVCLAAAPAAAQSRGFVGGLAGVTFNTESSAAVAGRAGISIGNGLFVFGEGGRIMNVLPNDIASELDDVERIIEEQFGFAAEITAKLPTIYALGGIRWEAPGEGRFRPFVEGGFGIAHITGEFDIEVAGLPIPDEFVDELNQTDLDTNEPMMMVGGGLKIELTPRVGLDVGYRYTRIFVGDDNGIDAPTVAPNMVYAGIVLSFGR